MRIKHYWQSFFKLRQPQQKIRRQAFDEIQTSLRKAFNQPRFRQYIDSLSAKSLLGKSVQMFVGSTSCPRNYELTKYLLEMAHKKSATEKQKTEAEYYRYFFIRMQAFKTDNKEDFDSSTQMLNSLAQEKDHPQSCVSFAITKYLVAKQLFNLADMAQTHNERLQTYKFATHYFQKSITEDQHGGFFYIGEIFRRCSLPDITEAQIKELSLYGAAYGDPLAYFRLANIYKEEGNSKLYIQYLRASAQGGVMEAQHSLGCEYKIGKHVQHDQLKAFSWFTHAAAHGFIYSKFNLVDMFLYGSSCGRIKKNKSAVLLKLDEINNEGPDFEHLIKELLDNPEIRKILDEQNEKAKQQQGQGGE